MDLRKKTLVLLALLAFSSHTLWAGNEGSSIASSAVQQKKSSISGTVKDEKGETIVGVSVLVKGTPNIGTVTDIDGRFTLNNVPQNATLVFSFVGMKKQEVAVDGKTNIAVVLESNAINMEELVVVGFGTQKKVNLTGAVGTVNAKELEARPVQNVAQALQGMVGGLNISQSSGSLESSASINIRGTATIGQGSSGSPLVLIDGMEGSLSAINPQDIENISVLKDAASSSVYGSRAPFGVILITTKKGKAGRTTINYSNSFRWSSPVVLPEMMDSYTFALYFNDACTNKGDAPFFNNAWLQRIKDFQDGKLINPANGLPMTTIPKKDSKGNNTNYWEEYGGANDNVDWYKAIYKSASPSQEHNISASGGNETTSYYISGNFLDQTGLMKFGGDSFNRYGATAKINTKLSDKVSVGYSGRWIREDYERPSSLGDGLYSDLGRQGWPILPVYDPNGNLFSSPSPALALRDGGRDKSQKDWFSQQLQLVVEPIKGWRITGELNYKTIDQFRHWDVQKTYNHGVDGVAYIYGNSNSSVHEEANRTNFFNPNIYTEYTKSINDHNFKVLLGFQSELNKHRDLGATKGGLIVPSEPTLTTSDGNGIAPTVNGGYANWSTMGVFSRLNYDYKGIYLLEANARYDGTSRYRSDKRWNVFPSFSLGWNVSKEAFWKPVEQYVNTFKLKASYGSLGNQNTTSEYPTYAKVGIDQSKMYWILNGGKATDASAPGLVSSTLGWEKIRTWNIGTELGFFNNRLKTSIDYYTRYTDDMISWGTELPATLGTDVPQTNNTDLKTTGFELELNWNDRLSNGLGYAIRVVVSDSRTKITRYSNPTSTLDLGQNDATKKKYIAGRYLGEIWGYTTKGIAKTDEEMNAHIATLPNGGQNALGNNWKAGDIMYIDSNGDGKIDSGSETITDHGDLSVIGNSTPRFPFAVDLSADWKGFDFRAFFQGIMKRDYFQNSYFFWGATSNIWWSTGFTQHEDYFRANANHPLGQNLDSYYARPVFDSDKNQKKQTRYLQNAAYVRLKNLQLGYTLPNEYTKKFGVQKVRVFVSGENIWTYTKLAKMFDPETIDGGNNGNGNAYPMSKVLSCGLSLNF